MSILTTVTMWVAIVLFVSLALGGLLNTLAVRADSKQFPAPGILVTVEKHKLHINCKGSSEITLLLEAGAGGSSLDWSAIQSTLEEQYRVCTYDRAGFGWSEAGPKPRDSQQIVSELDKLLQESDETGPFILAGHSFGGLLVRHFARKYPENVKGIILVDAIHESFVDALPEDLQKQQSRQFMMLKIGKYLAILGVVRALGLVSLPPNLPKEIRAVATSHAMRAKSIETIYQEGIVFEQSAKQMAQEAPLSRKLPIVVISRYFDTSSTNSLDADKIWWEHQLKLADLSNNSTHLVSTTTDHYIQLSHPELVVQAANILFAANEIE